MVGDMTSWKQGLCFGAFLLVAVVVCVAGSETHYTNSFVVEVQDGDSAHSLAKRHNLDYLGPVLRHHKNLHHFVKRSAEDDKPHSRRRRRSVDDTATLLNQDPMVKRVVQQEGYVRVKRGFKDLQQLYQNFDLPKLEPPKEEPKVWKNAPFNDPLLSKQWFIKNIGQADGRPGLDLNIEEAWKAGYTGKGVTIAIMDDGIDYLHPDIAPNFNANASYDFSSNDPLPYPRYTDDWFNSHGTRCAGEVSAVANNGVCGVGIAYNSKIAGIRMLDQPYMTDIIEASSMSHLPQEVDIYSASWGPQDNGKTVDGPRDFTLDAIANGVNNGRGGKGSIYVWASGDGGPMDDCNCDGYASSMWTVSINSAINDGRTALYDESCSSTLASTFSNGRKNRHPEAGVATTDLYGNCTLSHSGTSAAAPEAAGVFALALEANPDLTWRDIQHLTVLTSHKNQLYDENYEWQCNGVGLEFNHLFGFGVLDAGAMVKMAEKWKTADERFHCTGAKWNGSNTVRAGEKLVLKLNTDACTGQKGHVRYLEHTQAIITLNSSRRGDVTVNLTSPMGTRSILLSSRPQDDDNKDGFQHWPFMTTHTWGEDPRGEWMLEVAMVDGSDHAATLTEWSLVLHGTQTASYIEEANSRSKCKVKIEQLAKEAEEAAHNQTILDQREEEEIDQAMEEAMLKAKLEQEEEDQHHQLDQQQDYPDESEPSSDLYDVIGNGIYGSEASSTYGDYYSSYEPSYLESWRKFGNDPKFLALLKNLLMKED